MTRTPLQFRYLFSWWVTVGFSTDLCESDLTVRSYFLVDCPLQKGWNCMVLMHTNDIKEATSFFNLQIINLPTNRNYSFASGEVAYRTVGLKGQQSPRGTQSAIKIKNKCNRMYKKMELELDPGL